MTGLQAVLFDLDGTLIDSEGLWWRAECELVEQLGGTWTEQDQAHCLGGPLERVASYMVTLCSTTVPAEDVGQRLVDLMEGLLRTEPLGWRPGARELLIECRASGLPTGLVSASHRRLLSAVSDAVASDVGASGGQVFDISVAGDEVTDGKPHPEPYLAAAAALGVDIAGCVVIEDSPTGVTAGQASGAFVVAVPHLVAIPPQPRRVVLDTLDGVRVCDLAGWLASSTQ